MTGTRTDVAPCSCSRVDSDDDATLEAECEGGGTVLDLDAAVGIGVVIGVEAEESRGLWIALEYMCVQWCKRASRTSCTPGTAN